MTFSLETTRLVHRFSEKEVVLQDINLQVPEGSIYGFLGPNGAGKTTTLRLVLGLLKCQQGDIAVFGKPFHQNRVEILNNVGTLIESPSIYGHLTARENLLLLQKVYQCPMDQIQKVLELVDLANTGKKKAGQFSLGMKQRLSIAIALLHNPKMLILDEPTNGLDPNGMIDVRELLKRLNRELGITIIISSHLLAEIEKLVTHVGIINKGKLMFQGTLDELKGKQQQSLSIVCDTSDEVISKRIFSEMNIISNLKEGKWILPAMSKQQIATLNRRLIESGAEVFEMSIIKNDLEAIFLDLINH